MGYLGLNSGQLHTSQAPALLNSFQPQSFSFLLCSLEMLGPGAEGPDWWLVLTIVSWKSLLSSVPSTLYVSDWLR